MQNSGHREFANTAVYALNADGRFKLSRLTRGTGRRRRGRSFPKRALCTLRSPRQRVPPWVTVRARVYGCGTGGHTATVGSGRTIEARFSGRALFDRAKCTDRTWSAGDGALTVGVLACGAVLARVICGIGGRVIGLEPPKGALDANVYGGNGTGNETSVLRSTFRTFRTFHAPGAKHGIATETAVVTIGAKTSVRAAAGTDYAPTWHLSTSAPLWYRVRVV